MNPLHPTLPEEDEPILTRATPSSPPIGLGLVVLMLLLAAASFAH